MSYQIDAGAPLGESIRRIACEEIQAAIAASKLARNGKGTPVHQTLEHLEKARAALRLLATEVSQSSVSERGSPLAQRRALDFRY